MNPQAVRMLYSWRSMSKYAAKRKKNTAFTIIRHAKWVLVGAALADIATLGVGYYFYYQMKNNIDFRFKVLMYDERFVDLYHRANKKYGDGKAEEEDLKQWGIEKLNYFEFVHYLGL